MNKNIFLSFLLLALSWSAPPTRDETEFWISKIPCIKMQISTIWSFLFSVPTKNEIKACGFISVANVDVNHILYETFQVPRDDISNAQIFRRCEGEKQVFLAVREKDWELWAQVSEESGIHVHESKGRFSLQGAIFLVKFCAEQNLEKDEFYHASNLYMMLLLSGKNRQAVLSGEYWKIISNEFSDNEMGAFEKCSGDFLDQAFKQGIITQEMHDESNSFREGLLTAAEECFRVTGHRNEIFAILLKLRMSNFKYTSEDIDDLVICTVCPGINCTDIYIGYDDLPRYGGNHACFYNAMEDPENGLSQETKDFFRRHRYRARSSW